MSLRDGMAARAAAAREFWKQALDVDPLEAAGVLTAAYFLVHGGGIWYLALPLAVIGIAGLLLRPLLANSSYWLAMSAFAAFACFRNWHLVENDMFLATYWAIALHCSLLTRTPRETAGSQARWLTVLFMAIGCAWKFSSPDYLNGTFFKAALLTDGRLAGLSRVLAGVSASSQHMNGVRIAELGAFDATAVAVPILGGARLALAAGLLTWGTLALQALVTLVFVAPPRPFLARLKIPLLLALVLTVTALSKTAGFGWILLAMGVAHTSTDDRRGRGMCYAGFLLIHAVLIPFRVQ